MQGLRQWLAVVYNIPTVAVDASAFQAAVTDLVQQHSICRPPLLRITSNKVPSCKLQAVHCIHATPCVPYGYCRCIVGQVLTQGLSRCWLPAAGRVALERSSLQGLQLPRCQCNQAAAGRSRRGGRLTVQAASTIGGKKVNKVVLAYSGGLDTSVILKWLQDTYDCEVVTFTADLGQVSLGRQLIEGAVSRFWPQVGWPSDKPAGGLRRQAASLAGQPDLLQHAFPV